jgi:hypothetical protein
MLMLEVPPKRSDNISMMNEIDQTNRAINFVVQVSEMVSAYNERGTSYDMDKLMDEAYENEYHEMKNEDLPYALDIFNNDFDDPDAGWLNWECKSIRKWIGNKYFDCSSSK